MQRRKSLVIADLFEIERGYADTLLALVALVIAQELFLLMTTLPSLPVGL